MRAGRKAGMSVEFYATDEAQVQGVREVRGALVDAAAVVESPAYDQARVEVRKRRGGRQRMAVTLTVDALKTALRLEDTTEETAEATRLLAYCTEAVTRHLGARLR